MTLTKLVFLKNYLTSNDKSVFFPWVDDISINLVWLKIYFLTNIKSGKEIVQQCDKEFGNETDKIIDTEFGQKKGNFRKPHKWSWVCKKFSTLETFANSFSN